MKEKGCLVEPCSLRCEKFRMDFFFASGDLCDAGLRESPHCYRVSSLYCPYGRSPSFRGGCNIAAKKIVQLGEQFHPFQSGFGQNKGDRVDIACLIVDDHHFSCSGCEVCRETVLIPSEMPPQFRGKMGESIKGHRPRQMGKPFHPCHETVTCECVYQLLVSLKVCSG